MSARQHREASLQQQTERLRRELAEHGTDVRQNDTDPCGDGDQSNIVRDERRQFYRNLFSHGGDIAECLMGINNGVAAAMSDFGWACLTGNVARVTELLEGADRADLAVPPGPLVELLERRETAMRLSPLLLIVSAGKTIAVANAAGAMMRENQIKVA